MKIQLKIGIIGDFDENKISQVKTDQCLEDIATNLDIGVAKQWVSTDTITRESVKEIDVYDGIWAAPGDYSNPSGAILAIQYARENNIPFIGTWAGFQHALLEYAKNVLNLKDASHEAYSSKNTFNIISKLSCSLVDTIQRLNISKNTVAFSAYKSITAEEKFQCNCGFNQNHIGKFKDQNLTFSGFDTEGNIRMFEISNSYYYLATLFLPQLSSTFNKPHPIVYKFLRSCIKISTTKRLSERCDPRSLTPR